ncbi:MAG: NAD(P)/FAD-dependent oxidoreductase, partial [Gaiellaceae bacterium]
MNHRYDVAVVGLGLFGSAALRRLSARGVQAVGIGPAEPSSWATHTSVFASHYDSGRITRRIDRSHAWADLASRSIDAYGPLEARTAIDFHRPVGTLWADADGARIDGIAEVASALGVACELGTTEVAEKVHGFNLPRGLSHAFEAGPAGYIDPRKLLKAQLTAAVDDGATVLEDAVVAREQTRGVHSVRTLGGEIVEAERVLLATGAYGNAYSLAPTPLPMRVKTEVTIVAPVAPDDAHEHATLPTLIYGLSDSPLSDFYLVPPTKYPDGHYYL